MGALGIALMHCLCPGGCIFSILLWGAVACGDGKGDTLIGRVHLGPITSAQPAAASAYSMDSGGGHPVLYLWLLFAASWLFGTSSLFTSCVVSSNVPNNIPKFCTSCR